MIEYQSFINIIEKKKHNKKKPKVNDHLVEWQIKHFGVHSIVCWAVQTIVCWYPTPLQSVYLGLCGRADLMTDVSKYQCLSLQSCNYNSVNFRPSDLVKNTIILKKLDCINPVAIALYVRQHLLKVTPFIFIFLFINVY